MVTVSNAFTTAVSPTSLFPSVNPIGAGQTAGAGVAPATAGSHGAGADTIRTNALDKQTMIALNRAREQDEDGRVRLTATAIDFGAVKVGGACLVSFSLHNGGAEPVEGIVGSIGSPFAVVEGGGLFRLRTNESRTIVLRFSPTTEEAFNSRLEIGIATIGGVEKHGVALDGAGVRSASAHLNGYTQSVCEAYVGEPMPNPVDDVAMIPFFVPVPGSVLVELFDAHGERVATLLDERTTAGKHEVMLDATTLMSGVYMCRLMIGPNTATRRVVVVR